MMNNDKPIKTHFTVRLTESESIRLSEHEISQLNNRRKNLGEALLKKIKRSSGEVEFVSSEALVQLEEDKKRRRNQRKLESLRNPNFAAPQKNHSLKGLVKFFARS